MHARLCSNKEEEKGCLPRKAQTLYRFDQAKEVGNDGLTISAAPKAPATARMTGQKADLPVGSCFLCPFLIHWSLSANPSPTQREFPGRYSALQQLAVSAVSADDGVSGTPPFGSVANRAGQIW